jgi:hypothetical protein
LAAPFAVQASQAAAAAPEPGTEVAPGVYLESALHLTEANSGSGPGAAAVSPAARSVVADRIVGGHRTTVRKWPWQVALRYRRPDPYPPLFSCGGSLVAPNVVVTAAHCVTLGSATFRPPSEFDAVTGRTRLSSDRGQVLGLEDYYLFTDSNGKPLWNPKTVAWDAVFLVLDADSRQQPIKIAGPSESSLWMPGQRAFITGWGTTRAGTDAEVGNEKTVDVLREGRVRTISDAACNDVYGPVLIPSLMVCAGLGRGGVDACSGDSGGPLVVPADRGFRLIGDTSFAAGCGLPHVPGVYGRLASTPMSTALGNGIRYVTGANVIGAGRGATNRFSITGRRQDRERGTARLTVNVPGRGKIEIRRTRGVRASTAWPRRAGGAHVRVRPRKPLRRRLSSSGHARPTVTVVYTPIAGESRSRRIEVALTKR